jgi:hypothetical protein
MWHCPHCGAPQAETARCWVCRRSSTTCSTCTHFRRALAGDLGYCGLDARRRPLTGLEQRGCWEAKPAPAEVTVLSTVLEEAHRLRATRTRPPAFEPSPDAPRREFVPIDSLGGPEARDVPISPAVAAEEPPADEAPAPFVIEADERWADRTSLFGEPEG